MTSWSFLWSWIFVKFYFPGNLIHRVRSGSSAADIKFLHRGDAGAEPKSSLGEIEYVDIDIPGSTLVLLVCHGQLRSLDQGSVDQWREWGENNQISILLHNYPGYGKTPGPVTVDRILADLEQLVNLLKKKWSDEQICLLGNSAGCGPTISLAAREEHRFRKVILISPYTSCFSWGWQCFYPLRNSCFDLFVSIKLMPGLKNREVLMVCGKGDKTIPASNSEELFQILGKYSENHAKNYLCILPKEDHKYTRVKAMGAIGFFLKDQNDNLAEELERLAKGHTKVPHNKYPD